MNLTTGPLLMLKLRQLGPLPPFAIRLHDVVLNEALEQVYWDYRRELIPCLDFSSENVTPAGS
jgi:hypothetical protein